MKKKVKVRKGRVFCALIFLVVILTGCGLFLSSIFKNHDKIEKLDSTESTPKPVETPVETPVVKEKRMSLVMVGDALIHEVVYRDAKKSDGTYDFSSMFTSIKPLIEKYDLKYYNQETIIGGGTPATYPRFNTPDAFADCLIDLGFNMVSLANNHSLDQNESGILYSNAYWAKKTSVVVAGTHSSNEERNNIPIHEQNGISYAFLSYTMATNGLKRPNGKDYLLDVYDADLVKKDVEYVKQKGAEVIIVAMHWGNEYTHVPNSTQKEVAQYLSDLGVNLIIGAHPHVIQPMDYVGDTLVIYSLGNFISGHETPTLDKITGLLVGLDIVVDADGKVTFENIDKKLLYTYCTASRHDFKVIPYSEVTDEMLKNHEQKEKEYLEIVG